MPAKPAPVVDPYATLGLEPGATAAEVKRAYRRLAKAFHPDSAGEQAIPRFLAIQAAYEQIRTGRVTLGGVRGARTSTGTTGAASAGGSSEPWRADPDRARAARERARTGAKGAGAGTSGRGSSGGSASGSASGAGSNAGATAGGRKTTGTSGTGGTRRRATRKATMGSTSYDEARDPADATWSGASWYGPSTGEYWIVNPREYADPRKHGPDYQQRARRPLHDSAAEPPPPVEEAIASTPPRAESAPPSAGAASAPPRSEPRPNSAPRPRPAPRWSANETEAGWANAGEAPSAAPARSDAAPAPLRWLGEPADDPVRRLGFALVAWPPIGLAAAALIGDATGCTTFSALCDGSEPLLPWLAQAVILGLLLLIPAVTRILAMGTIAVLIGFVPLTSLLLAAGAAGASEAAPVLSVLLAVLWTVGVVLAMARSARRRGARM